MSSGGLNGVRANRERMVGVPDGISLERHRDLAGRTFQVWWRRGLVVLLTAFLVLGLLNVFGQRPDTTNAAADAATLELYAPSHLRSGLLYEARFTIFARHELKNALLSLSPGWSEGQEMNTIEPVPATQASRDGDLIFTLGHVARGTHYRLFVQFQVNPTDVAWHRPANVTLYDSGAVVLRIHHTLTVFP